MKTILGIICLALLPYFMFSSISFMLTGKIDFAWKGVLLAELMLLSLIGGILLLVP